MKKGKEYKVKLPGGGWRTLTLTDVVHKGEAMTAKQVNDYYGISKEKKKTLRGYMRPLRHTNRFVFAIPASLVKRCGIRGSRFMVLTDSFGLDTKKVV